MKSLKLCSLILIIFSIFSMLAVPKVYASDDIISEADAFIEAGKSASGSGAFNLDNMKVGVSKLLQIATDFGVVIAIGVGIYLGVKILTAPVNEKADAKQTLFAYLCGVFVTFGAYYIWKLVVSILIK